MFVVVRAIVYATTFIGLIIMFVPFHLLSWLGITRPAAIELWQGVGMIVGALGTILVLWCVYAFAFIGKGTPAPFDPPRKLVIRGPYRFVRNPMYMGAGLVLAGVSIYYESFQLLSYTALFFLIAHLFVVFYEEPTLRKKFGPEYEKYCRKIKRWWPGL